MGQHQEISIKLAYYCFEDMVNIEDFHSDLEIEILIFTILVTLRLRELVIMKTFIA